MKRLKICIAILLLVFTSIVVAAPDDSYILIYNGPASCAGCAEAIADVVDNMGLASQFVSDPDDIPRLLEDAKIFVIGGTTDNLEPLFNAFNEETIDAVQDYIEDGGNYLGICGGAFAADKNLFDIIPATAENYMQSPKAHLEKIIWKGKPELMYFQAGPKFILNNNNATGATIIARYSNNDIAAFSVSFGKGDVVVIGPHPEADATWLAEDHIDAKGWQSTQQLLVNVINDLLSNN